MLLDRGYRNSIPLLKTFGWKVEVPACQQSDNIFGNQQSQANSIRSQSSNEYSQGEFINRIIPLV